MNTRLPSRARAALLHRHRYRCQVEELDRRLPPGALMGPLGLDMPYSAFGQVDSALFQDQGPVPSLSLLPPSMVAFDGVPFLTQSSLSSPINAVRTSREVPRVAAEIPAFDTLALPSAATASLLGAMLNAGATAGYAGPAENQGSLGTVSSASLALTRADSSEADLLTRLVLNGRDQPRGQAIGLQQPSQAEEFGQVPLWFEANVGQTDAQVGFLSRGGGYTLFLTPAEAVLSLQRTTPAAEDATGFDTPSQEGLVVRMEYVGANRGAGMTGEAELAGKVNYFTGNDPRQWHSNISTYGRVEYSQLYAGIDLVWYSNAQNQLEYDFVVTSGADPSDIALQFRGVDGMAIDPQGDLLLQTPFGTLRQPRPFTYQEVGGVRQEVASGYTLTGQQVGFAVGAYDASLPLVIDPVLTYSTFLGGSDTEDGYGITVDAAGSAFVTGGSFSTDFPTTAGVVQGTNVGGQDIFVAKLSPDGSSLEYASYLGGDDNDRGHSIAVDGAGNAYVAGRTGSQNFPTTAGVMQGSFRGGAYEAFTAKLDSTGSTLVWSTYLGGDSNDAAFGVAVGADEQVYVTGGTLSQDFPVTPNAFQFINYLTDGFMTVLLPDASNTPYSTYFGSSFAQERANAIAVDGNGLVYIGGQTRGEDFATSIGAVQMTFGGGLTDGFVIKFNPTLSSDASFLYGTYLGGDGDDRVHGIAVDAEGNAYVTGMTGSMNFPLLSALQGTFGGGDTDAFVTKLNADGSGHLYSTYLGGSANDKGNAIAVNGFGEAYVTGATASADFPTLDAIQGVLAGAADAFVAKLAAGGDALVWSTFLGGTADENNTQNDSTNYGGIALDGAGNVYLIGRTESPDYPTTAGAFDTTCGTDGACNNDGSTVYSDAFVAKLSDTTGPGVLFCFTITPDSGTFAAGTSLTLTLMALDSNLEVVTDYAGEVAFFTNDDAATLPATYMFQAADMGIATFPNGFIFRTPGLMELYVFDTATYLVYGYAAFTVQ